MLSSGPVTHDGADTMPKLALPALLLSLAACAHAPGVSSGQLPLRRVVVYRNGVGYFERAGTVDGKEVAFRVRPSHVGDFLATLAVVERGGSSVRAASFPIRGDREATPGGEVPEIFSIVAAP